MRSKFSLLSKRESKRSLRQAIFFSLLTIVLIVLVIVYGIPAIIKMAVFFGNINSSSTPIESKNKIPPSPPIFKSTFDATNSAKLSLSGFAKAGSTIKISLTGQPAGEVVADKDGNFSFNDLTLTLGNNEITAVAVDADGNQSAESDKLTIWYNNQPPKLDITQPTDGAIITNESGIVEIVGQTDAEASVSINEHLVVVDNNGNFKSTFNLVSGNNLLNIVATDKAGNQTVKTINLTYSP